VVNKFTNFSKNKSKGWREHLARASRGYITNNVKNVLLLYNAAIVKANSFKDMENITQYYVNEIIDSSLTEEEKGGLLSGFVVNIQSIYYWGNFSKNN